MSAVVGTVSRKAGRIDTVEVPAHTTERLTTREGWVISRVRTGCIRVQKGDFCAYLQADEARLVSQFIDGTDQNIWPVI